LQQERFIRLLINPEILQYYQVQTRAFKEILDAARVTCVILISSGH